MRLRTKWLLISVVGGVVITATLLFSENVMLEVPPSVEAVARVVLWPVAVCEYLVGPGPNIGPPEKHQHEATPVQFLAAVIGIGLSWMFYSSVLFVILRSRHRHGSIPTDSAN